jgi:hypothetical protein
MSCGSLWERTSEGEDAGGKFVDSRKRWIRLRREMKKMVNEHGRKCLVTGDQIYRSRLLEDGRDVPEASPCSLLPAWGDTKPSLDR